MPDDWRLMGQERYLQGVSLTKKQYHKYSASWDHDHCEFCGAKFSEGPGDLHSGYATSDKYRWICDGCFHDFRELFQWSIAARDRQEEQPEH